jgi:diadenylate cyclase
MASTLAQSDVVQGLRFFVERVAFRPWVALIELLLIGSVVYAILRSLEGTRGARLVRAVLTILAVSFAVVWLLAERFEFERINTLYPYFILAVFLVSLVAFQTELRRLLLQLGEGAWLQRWLRGPEQEIESIITAAERLSARKIGALIALERNPEEGSVVESGVRMDALVSTELLETIFWPGSALHDLGVLIHGGRIRAAGCQFPLADSADVDRSLGSRHRAAIGLSEESDVVVVVVSEETGSISIASRGRLQRGLRGEDFRTRLRNELVSAAAASPRPTARSSDDLPGDSAPEPEPSRRHSGGP